MIVPESVVPEVSDVSDIYMNWTIDLISITAPRITKRLRESRCTLIHHYVQLHFVCILIYYPLPTYLLGFLRLCKIYFSM